MIARCGWFSFADDLVTLLALQRALLILLSLVLAAPVAGVLLSWLRLDGQALAVLSHQAETVMAGYAGQSLVLAGGVALGTALLGVCTAAAVALFRFPGHRFFEWGSHAS